MTTQLQEHIRDTASQWEINHERFAGEEIRDEYEPEYDTVVCQCGHEVPVAPFYANDLQELKAKLAAKDCYQCEMEIEIRLYAATHPDGDDDCPF